MPSTRPPLPSTRTLKIFAVGAVVTLLYSLVVAGQILLWFVLVGGVVGLYLVWLLIVAIFRLVEAVERIATAAEVDSGIRRVSEVGAGDDASPADTHAGGADASDRARDDR